MQSAMDAINQNITTAPPSPQGQIQGPGMNGSYWIGQDGNVWYASSSGTKNMGTPINTSMGGFDAQFGSAQAGSIGDPNVQQQTTQTDFSSGGGGAAAPTYKDTTAEREGTQLSLDSLGTIRGNALTGADTEYKNVTDAYGIENAENLTKYNKDVESNEITRDGNTQAALRGAAQGSRGLYSTLASIGALGGTGRQLANRAVATEANTDLGAGEKSFETNVESLFDTRGLVEKEEKQRQLDADKILKDTKQGAEYDYLKGNQDLSSQMAKHWTDAGNNGEADNWTRKASAFTPQMAAQTKVNPAQYARKSLKYAAPEMDNYLGGLNSTAVNVASGNPVNGALYTSTRKKDEL